MGLRAVTTCGKPGCPTLVKAGTGGYCPTHLVQRNQQINAERSRDEVRRLYSTKRWERFAWWMLCRNQPCQRLVDGQRCEQGATICHHIVSPRVELHRMFDAENILCVCAGHHPNTAGEADVTRYVKTITD
jgi:hypothetical protein